MLAPADEIAETMMEAILGDLAPKAGAPVLLFVNGFGGTPLMELYLMYDAREADLRSPQGIDDRPLAGGQLHDLAGHGRLLASR